MSFQIGQVVWVRPLRGKNKWMPATIEEMGVLYRVKLHNWAKSYFHVSPEWLLTEEEYAAIAMTQ